MLIFKNYSFLNGSCRWNLQTKYSVGCSKTSYTTRNLHSFSTFFFLFFFTYSGSVNPYSTPIVHENYFIMASTVHSVKHDWFFRLILNRNIFCTMNWECLCFHYFDDRKIFNKFINLSFQLILFSTENWITLIYMT